MSAAGEGEAGGVGEGAEAGGEGGRTRMARPAGNLKRVEPPAPERVERAADAVAALPWEPARAGRTRVLFLVANSSRAPVNAEVEERKIGERLRGHGRFKLEKVPDVRAEDLFVVLRDQRPAVVHFSGHGHGAAGLAMKNRDGQPTSITARELALHFRDLAAQGIAIRCVVLNACLAEAQALALAPYVDFVVGTTALVGDEVAVTFADNFYLALTEGRAVAQAFEAARARCGGDVEGAEKTFRLFFSEPRAPKRRVGLAVAAVAVVAAAAVGGVMVAGGGAGEGGGDAGVSGEGAGRAVGAEVGAAGHATADGGGGGEAGSGAAAGDVAGSGAVGSSGAAGSGAGDASGAVGTSSADAGVRAAAVGAEATTRRVVRRGRLCARDNADRRNVLLTAECACIGARPATAALKAQLDRDPGDCRAWYTCNRVDPGACR